MLCMTRNAAILVSTLVEGAALPAGGGVRIVTDPHWRSLSMSTAATPAPEETVVSSHGANLFLPPAVARKLTARTLCAEITSAKSAFYFKD